MDGSLYRALLERDSQFDGSVYYAITSTGIFCRPVCSARKPKPENVRYFDSAKAALNAGFRPCKLCEPLNHPDTIPPAYRDLMDEVSADQPRRLRDYEIRARGIEPETLRRWFKRRFGMTFQAYARSTRLARAFDALRCGQKVLDTALAAGYGGSSGFGAAVKEQTGLSPVKIAASARLLVSRFETPLGTMVAGDWQGKLCLLEFADRRALEKEILDLERLLRTRACPGRSLLHAETERQVLEYFGQKRRAFDLPLATPGSDFQKAVWQVLMQIPYGETRSYREQAHTLGRPEAVRAVANANGQNRLALIIPCHRVIGSDGSLTGYGGGLHRKKALLELETGQRSWT